MDYAQRRRDVAQALVRRHERIRKNRRKAKEWREYFERHPIESDMSRPCQERPYQPPQAPQYGTLEWYDPNDNVSRISHGMPPLPPTLWRRLRNFCLDVWDATGSV